MASLSLPRVLQLKKNSLEAEREQFEKFQTLAIQKAINSVETPVKEKHVRSAIIGTFQDQSAITYWMVAIRLPIQDNRIVAWKFCHVTHKLLREGHPACLDDSQRHISMIENLGKLWVHLREGYGKLVHLYCNLLVCKLKFHARNPRFPGNMQLTAEELDAIAENDVNNYFQLCVELFDYMDDILTLQAAVFDSLGNARANSMTASGQCRLAALIPCAQDASQLYDCNVRLLFRLHAALPADTLVGHRDRFRQQFKKLSSFYKHASSLQYYRNLLTLPVLPSNPPNFLIQSDFGTYVTPVVSIPEPPPDEVDAVGSLIDTSDTMSQMTPDHLEEVDTRPTPSPQPDPVIERDRLIDHLQNELKRMRTEVSQLLQERNTMISSMREHCTKLETKLLTAQSELEQERHKAEILSVETPEIKQKLTETEEKAKVTDEKFQKLKGAYTQLREEHITLIRQKAEKDKLAASLRAAAAQQESAKVALQQQLSDKMKDVEILQQSASTSEEIEAYKSEIANLRAELEQSRQKEVELETVKASMEALEIEHKTASTEHVEILTVLTNELKEANETLERVKQENEQKETELVKVKQELIGLREKSGDEYKRAVEEKEAAFKQISELTEFHQKEKEEFTHSVQNHVDMLETELENLQQQLIKTENEYSIQCEQLQEKANTKIQQLEIMLKQKDIEIKEFTQSFDELQSHIDKLKADHEIEISNKKNEISVMREKLDEIFLSKSSGDDLCKTLIEERNSIVMQLEHMTKEKECINETLLQKISEISNLEKKIEEIDNIKKQELFQVQEEGSLKLGAMRNEIDKIQTQFKEKTMLSDKLSAEIEILSQKITVFEKSIEVRDKQIEELSSQLSEATSMYEKQKIEYEILQKEVEYARVTYEEKLQNISATKDLIIDDLKTMVAEKDEQVIKLTVESRKLNDNIKSLNETITETQAELEITKDELLNLREEYQYSVKTNQENIDMKNLDLRSLHDRINELSKVKIELEEEKETLINKHRTENQVLENKINELENNFEQMTTDLQTVKEEKEDLKILLNDRVKIIKSEMEQLKDEKESEIKHLLDQVRSQETNFNIDSNKKDEIIAQAETNIEELKIQLEDLQKTMAREKEEMDNVLTENAKLKQSLEARLEHTESERLNAECELQDLLQHNTVLEADVAALRRQLEDAQRELENQNTRLVTCAGEAALEVTNDALAALERSDAQDTSKLAAENAVNALEQLANITQVKGNEETIARSAILVAHNASQLSAYVTEVTNVSTNIELSDKLNGECKSMLTATKRCLESIKKGSVERGACTEVRGHVQGTAQAAAAADRLNSGARSVDDELADMDLAIEQAASQIEDMLAASRAGDSGVKLEVNEKILDACTTLMGAVKMLVQDARKLQHELGDPKTRQKMYRKNPQWSEGLISAAKAVVFAAKLLVSSADEAVGAAGRVEGVSAAAHEVAGSTAQLVAASRARAPPSAPALARLTQASRSVAAATGAVVAAVRAGSALVNDQEALDTTALTLTATRRLEMESKVRSLELEVALDAERRRLAALRKRHYHLAQQEENGNITNGKE